MADWIERDAAIDCLDSNAFDSYENAVMTLHKIEDIPAVNRWIPCSERMPENNTPVLYVWRGQSGAVAVFHGWHFEIRSLGRAWHQSGTGIHKPDEEVTHWMPIPEPPSKDDET